ncbi:MAG: KH domain-containing protein [Nanoarchaeota archaeon]|nr:KH domain-containing protein [Nanoarchaeota archaeon]
MNSKIFSQELKIPQKRVAVLIGTKGVTKKLLERKTKTKIGISKLGDVVISSNENINCFNAVPIITAVGRGFNPEIALLLLDENFIFEMISMKDYARNEKDMARMRSRIIGSGGKARQMFETLTGTSISVYGKTVAIIGNLEKVILAKKAIQKLLKGSPHGNVYKYIEREQKKYFDV